MTQFHIVLAEDNPADVYLIRQALTEHRVSCDICLVRDGKSAIRLLRSAKEAGARPDLILLDLNLPQHDGIEILNLIRESEDLAKTPVAIVSSSHSPRDHRVANSLGVVQYIQKPLELEAFMSLGKKIKELLNDTGGPEDEPGAVRIYEWPGNGKDALLEK